MDRSRLVVALALVFALLGTILSIANISVASTRTGFTSSVDSFLTAGQAGIAVIEISGVIEDGYGVGGVTGADRVVEDLDAALKNPAIRGVILAINSPGGTVGATKKIYDKVMEVRRQRPVMAVVTDIAASGGYYVASAADKIFVYRGSIIGSIGVIIIRPNVAAFLADHGIRIEALTAGQYKDASYPFRELTGEERNMYQQILDDSYQQFLEDVRAGRDEDIQTVETWAEGRIFSGEDARTLQMVDEIGNMDSAIFEIKSMAKIDPEKELPLLRPEPDFWQEFMRGAPPFGFHDNPLEQVGGGFWRRNMHSPVMFLYTGGPGLTAELIREFGAQE
ncbi:MAG: signal peptide peptidase SppA [Leptospiraceae bacterium]|nr:signal peptide peptidase SppA [Leptospiraceae bacterium]